MASGTAQSLPIPAPFPPAEIRHTLPSEEWEACLKTWILCVESRLRLSDDRFELFEFSDPSSGFPFLKSYFSSPDAIRGSGSNELRLHRCSLLLLRRLLVETKAGYNLDAGDLFLVLVNVSNRFLTSKIWRDTLDLAWKRHDKDVSLAVRETKGVIIELAFPKVESNWQKLWQLVAQMTSLVKCSPQVGRVMMTGSDYLDSLVFIYDESDGMASSSVSDPRKTITENLSVCLTSLMSTSNPSLSTLVDVLYELKSMADGAAKENPNRATLLSSIVCLTTFIGRFEGALSKSPVKRGEPVLQFLRSYRSKMLYLHHLPRLPPKSGQVGTGTDRTHSYFHQLVGLAQLQDLFPDADQSRLTKLLAQYSGNVEAVTSVLLEQDTNVLGAQPDFLDKGKGKSRVADVGALTQGSPMSRRRNKFDGDDFDNLAIPASQIHQGRKALHEDIPDASDKAKKKAAILSALAAFDSDEDERDDTYDIADVGGAVDNTLDTDDRRATFPHEPTLFKAWRGNPEIFARDTNTRLSQPRQQLQRETGMGHEQLEGWAIMLSRDPSALRRLESKYTASAGFGGQQKLLDRTKWSNPMTDDDTDTGNQEGSGPARGIPSHRGMAGRGGFGRGGSTAGPADDVKTQNARRKKEQGRGRGGANHNRRDGRAKKMGRGFGAPPGN